jgi:hypothetical protein
MKTNHIAQILAAGLLWSANTPADVIWSGDQNLSNNYQTIDVGFWLHIDMNADSQTDVSLAYSVYSEGLVGSEGYDGHLWAYVDDINASRSNRILVDASNNQDAALSQGSLISGTPDSSLEWKSGSYAAGRVSYWISSPPSSDEEWRGLLGETGDVYLGIAFEAEGATHYGWVNVTLGEVNPDFGFETPIMASWAYESTPDTPIVAGVIPEPSTGILTMVGSLSILLIAHSRRRR